MDEREHHDNFYSHESAVVFDSPLFAEARRRMAAVLLAHGRGSPGDRVLSLGCGDGRVECLMASSVGEVVGIELSSVAVEQARARAEQARCANVRFRVGDIRQLDLPAASFDAIWALGVLHHLDDVAVGNLLQRCVTALRPGGVMLSSDPSAGRLIGAFKWLFARQYDRYHSPDEHEIDPQHLRERYLQAGFVTAVVHYSDFFLGPFAWLSPNFPRPLVPAVAVVESLLLAVPGLRPTASSFFVIARAPTSSVTSSAPINR